MSTRSFAIETLDPEEFKTQWVPQAEKSSMFRFANGIRNSTKYPQYLLLQTEYQNGNNYIVPTNKGNQTAQMKLVTATLTAPFLYLYLDTIFLDTGEDTRIGQWGYGNYIAALTTRTLGVFDSWYKDNYLSLGVNSTLTPWIDNTGDFPVFTTDRNFKPKDDDSLFFELSVYGYRWATHFKELKGNKISEQLVDKSFIFSQNTRAKVQFSYAEKQGLDETYTPYSSLNRLAYRNGNMIYILSLEGRANKALNEIPVTTQSLKMSYRPIRNIRVFGGLNTYQGISRAKYGYSLGIEARVKPNVLGIGIHYNDFDNTRLQVDDFNIVSIYYRVDMSIFSPKEK